MALTSPVTINGFQFLYNLMQAPGEDPETFELTPNTAFSIGDLVTLTNRKVAAAATASTTILGVMAQAFTAAANPTTGLTYGQVLTNPFNVYRVSFSNHLDSTASASGTTTTLIDTVGITSVTDNALRGALIYFYAGAGAGNIRTVSGYTGASHTVTWINPLPVATDTTTKYIILGPIGGSTADQGINIGAPVQLTSGSNTLVDAGTYPSGVGQFVVKEINPKNLTMDVVLRRPLLNIDS